VLDNAATDEFAAKFRGQLIRPGDHHYEAARRVWNGMIDKRPALIARCAGAADVRAAITFARDLEQPIAIRGGGHNVAGTAICDDGIVIDLSACRGIRVDPKAGTARAEPGVTWAELDHETQAFGLATTGGMVSTTGIAGLTLGGGLGWLARRNGTTCDNLLSADIVTADARVLTASPDENSDLFWALRGGGGNFGVVTSFEYRLHRVGPTVLAGPVFHAGKHIPQVLRFLRDYLAAAPDELTIVASFMTAAPGSPLPPEAHGTTVVAIVACYAGDLDAGERVLRPLRAFGRPLADLIQPIPYGALQGLGDAGYPSGRQNYWKSSYVPALSDAMTDTVIEHAARMTSPLSGFYFEQLGGAIAKPREETAFGHRDAAFDFAILSSWQDPGEDDIHIAWTREFWNAMQPFASRGVYVNNLGTEGEERVQTAYDPLTYDRLTELKRRYDPENILRFNQNIHPCTAPALL
jgi:FAD/FMN-containing dehydrogenase